MFLQKEKMQKHKSYMDFIAQEQERLNQMCGSLEHDSEMGNCYYEEG